MKTPIPEIMGILGWKQLELTDFSDGNQDVEDTAEKTMAKASCQ